MFKVWRNLRSGHDLEKTFVRAFLTVGALALGVCALASAEPPPQGKTLKREPRPLSNAERSAVALAFRYFQGGAESWWDFVARSSPLRALGKEAALAEIRTRLGPTDGATWRLRTPAPRYRESAVFSIEYLSGFDETVLLQMVVEDGRFKLGDLRSRADPVAGPSPRLAALEELRRGLALGRQEEVGGLFRAVLNEPSLIRIARLWQAQQQLEDLDDKTALRALKLDAKEHPAASLPLAALLRARLAFVRYDSLEMAAAYNDAFEEGIDHDGLRFEALEAQVLLGFIDERGFRTMGTMGTRIADVYYTLAKLAVFHKDGNAADYFRTAWNLQPREREWFLSEFLLAQLVEEEEIFELLELGEPEEPRVGPPATGRTPMAFPNSVDVLLSGNHLSLLFDGDREIEVPGGGVLAPREAAAIDAGTERRRREEVVLADLEEIIAAARSPTALAHPRLRRRMESAAVALTLRKRWQDLLRLTHGIADEAEHAGSVLGQLRALALTRLGYENEAIVLLRRLAAGTAEGPNRDPGVLYQLAKLAADHERYDLAIRLVRQGDAAAGGGPSLSRIWQLELDRDLAASHKVHKTRFFTIRYPIHYADAYAEKMATFLEAERKRLKSWIPVTTERPYEVAIFPPLDFKLAFGFRVLGLFDGKIRIPLERTPGQKIGDRDVLTHELVHAMIDEYAGEDVPDWFHEGLAQFLEHTRPDENPIPDLYREKRLLSIPMVEAVFSGNPPASLRAQAYEEAAWALRFMNSRFGMSGIRRMLAAFKAGQSTEAAVTSALRSSSRQFDDALWRWARSGSANALLADLPDELPEARVGFVRNPVGEMITEHVDAMREWYRYYSARVREAKLALRQVVGALRGHGETPMQAACQNLEAKVSELIADPKVFECPAGDVKASLDNAYLHFKKMARACRQGHSGVVQAEMKLAEDNLRQAASTLGLYGLKP